VLDGNVGVDIVPSVGRPSDMMLRSCKLLSQDLQPFHAATYLAQGPGEQESALYFLTMRISSRRSSTAEEENLSHQALEICYRCYETMKISVKS